MMANILMCVLVGTGAGVYNEEFARAAKAYDAGDYATAIGTYEQMVGESVAHEALFYNLGNAYYRSGRLGAAIANYERALELDPGFDNARENLEKAVRETRQHLARPLPSDWEQSLLFWHYLVSRETTTRLALLFWLGFWVVLGLRQFRPVRYTRPAAAVLAVLALAFGGSAWAKAHGPALAVADADAAVTYGTSESDAVRFELYPGDRVTVDQRRNGWARVKTASGEHGWTRELNLVFVGPPYARMDEAQKPAPGNTTAREKETSAS
ncbi:MAG: tetratricopeptide repeat protein [Candidatus Hydrogenedentes bacterium]|nr:tetratricopeptide repeat protein [Candidatus Hydrogenedentota bacterium]